MNLEFSEEQQALRASAREVLAAEAPLRVVREAADDPERWRPLWKIITQLGWPALPLPASGGGLALGVAGLVGLVEITGAALLPVPLLTSAGLATPVLVAAGAADELLGPLAEGTVATLAYHGADVTVDGGRLHGVKRFVPEAERAGMFAVTAVDPDGRPVVAVARPGAGVDVRPTPSVDPTRPLADVAFDVPAAAILTRDPEPGLAAARVSLAAELVGVCDRVLELSVQHAKGRGQFGHPIGSFQGVKHRLADAYILTERARSLTYHAAALLDGGAGAQERDLAVALAKAAASEAGVAVAKTGVQVHGAVAMTWEHDLHLYLRRARCSALALGDQRHHYRRAGELYLRMGA